MSMQAEGLYIELTLTFCYDYVRKCCACVSEHFKEMHKERECPEKCKVAVSSLVYAAARFSDLPELRDLRNLFNGKYDKSLESYVSEEFVEKLKSKPPTTEMKIQLMQEIAQEFSITWDSLPLQQQLYSDQSVEKSTKLASDKMFKSMSTVAEVQGKQEDNNNKLMNEEQKDKLRNRRYNSYSKFNTHVSEILQEQNNIDETISGERGVDTRTEEIESTTKETDNSNSKYDLGLNKKDDDDLYSIRKQRPRSVRTKILNSTPSSPTMRRGKHGVFSPEEGEEEVSDKLMTRYSSADRPSDIQTLGNNAKNKKFPISTEKEENAATPTSALPPPPGRRRYLFAQSLSASPMREAARSKFLPPDYQELI
ncbi:hypothetical protein RND81_09G118100 [Saponaria officinalis]|uniref:Uncharacterized protein n=1 Tax=Saponaria officinalis TaxID=3572 RepID=A0AAW1IJM3_SAPOF